MAEQTAETAAALDAAKAALDAAQAKHDAAVTAAAGPRSQDAVAHDLFEAIVMRLGNRPELRALLKEMFAGAAS